ICQQHSLLFHFIPGLTFAHLHLIGATIGARRRKQQFFAYCPEAQQANAELALHSLRAILLELSFYRIADVSRHELKVWESVLVPRNPLSIVLDAQKVLSSVPAASNRNVARRCVDTVLH